MRPADRLIVALDHTRLAPAVALARRLRGLAGTVKVGSVLFTACGPEAVAVFRRLGFDVMLDLKFHDIPQTVELSCRAAVAHRVAFLTVHAGAGPDVLRAAVRGTRSEARRRKIRPPRILGITVLTSVKTTRTAWMTRNVLARAQAALAAGCDGVVASAREAPALRRRFGRRLTIVCPGIRPAQASAGDQHRIATPADALRFGANWLVVGRPITAAKAPARAARAILEEMDTACL